jgi:Leucine Rich repeat
MSTDTSGANLPAAVAKAVRLAKADPNNDAGLLALAKALEQNGDRARADYFRAVVAKDQPDLAPGEWRRHIAREMALYRSHFEEWFGRLAARTDQGGYTAGRGFPDVLCYDGDLVEDGDTGLGNLSDSRGWPWGGQLSVVHRSDLSGAEIIRRLLDLSMMAEVFELYLCLNNVTGPAAASLGKIGSIAHLRGLHLHQSEISTPAVKALVESPVVQNLRAFSVWADGAGLAAVSDAAGLKNVRELRIRGDKLGPKDWARLGNSPHLTAVRSLDVAETPLNAESMAALAGTPLMNRLESLDVGMVADPDGTAEALAASPNVVNLREFFCRTQGRASKIASAGLIALTGSAHLGSLRSIDLTYGDVKADGIKALARSKTLIGLERLILRGNPLGAAGGKALAGSSVFAHLTDLRLGDCRLGEGGGLAVAGSPHLGGLRVLNLAGNGMSGAAARAIARPGAFDRLRVLILGYNKIDDSGVAALAQAEHLRDLGFLDLSGQGRASIVSDRDGKILTDAAMNTLLESATLADLALLCLEGNATAWRRREDLAARFGGRVDCRDRPVRMHLYR